MSPRPPRQFQGKSQGLESGLFLLALEVDLRPAGEASSGKSIPVSACDPQCCCCFSPAWAPVSVGGFVSPLLVFQPLTAGANQSDGFLVQYFFARGWFCAVMCGDSVCVSVTSSAWQPWQARLPPITWAAVEQTRREEGWHQQDGRKRGASVALTASISPCEARNAAWHGEVWAGFIVAEDTELSISRPKSLPSAGVSSGCARSPHLPPENL